MKFTLERKMLLPAAFAAAVLVCAGLLAMSFSLRKERGKVQDQRREVLLLKEEYLAVKTAVDAVEGRRSLTKVEGIMPAMDEIVRTLGLAQKVKSVKATGTRDQGQALEEEAELQMEKVTMNELVNILYRVENAPMILTVKKTSIRTSFENPSLLNLTLNVVLVRPK